MKHKALVLALMSATTSVPGAAQAADDNICAQLLIYAIDQFCQLLPNGQSLCQPVALAGPSPSCELPDAQASMVQVPVGPPALQFPTFPTFGGTPNYFPPGAWPQFPYPQFPYPQFAVPQFPSVQNPSAGNSFQPPAWPIFPYPDYPNPYFPFTTNPSIPPASPQLAKPAAPTGPAVTERPASAQTEAVATKPDTPAATPIAPSVDLSTPIQVDTAPVATNEGVTAPIAAVQTTTESAAKVEASTATEALQTIASEQPVITPADSPAANAQASSTDPVPVPLTADLPATTLLPSADTGSAVVTASSAPDASLLAAIPATAADQTAAAENARQDALAHFEFDSAELTPRGRAMLDEWLAKATSNMPVLVTGHADRLGPEPYNEKLSLLRAQAVKQYLTGKGKPALDIEIKAKGEKTPLIDCAGEASPQTKACLAPNRRAEVVFKPLVKPARKAAKPVSRIVKPGSKR